MGLLGDPLTTRPIQTGWEFTFEPYPSWQFRCIDNPDLQFGNSSVWAQTRVQPQSDSQEPLLTLHLCSPVYSKLLIALIGFPRLGVADDHKTTHEHI